MRLETLCRLIYSVCCALLLPFALGRLLWRSRRDADYRARIGERLGFYTATVHADSIWIHAVSVGELLAAQPLVAALALDHPQSPILLTTTTPAASRLVRRRFGASVLHVYLPWDMRWIVRRFLLRFRPRIAIFVETELWPNLIDGCVTLQIPVILANARMSARSATAYTRVMRPLTRLMMRQLHAVAAQSAIDAARFTALGVPIERVGVTGNMKFDIAVDAEMRTQAAIFRALADPGSARMVWIAASTHEGEEDIVLQALTLLRVRHPDLLLVLVPRHAERAAAVLQSALRHGFAAAFRSMHTRPQSTLQVLIVDTLGELPWLYGAANVAFVGGSLVAVGGHNLLEPAVWGVPVLCGRHLFNFEAISEAMHACGALLTVQDAQSMAARMDELLGDPLLRARMGAAAKALVAAEAGAVQRVLALVGASLV